MAAFLLLVFWIFLGRAAGWQTPAAARYEAWDGTEKTFLGIVYARETKNQQRILYLKQVREITSENSESENTSEKQKSAKTKFHNQSENIPGLGETLPCRMTVWISSESAQGKIGSQVVVKGICMVPETPGNPGQFDERSYYDARNIGLFLKKAEIKNESAYYSFIKEKLASFREKQLQILTKNLESLEEKGDMGVLAAMLLGEKGYLEEETKTLYQKGGISHILAISGLHITLIGMALYKGCRLVFGGFVFPAALGGIAMVYYGWFTGGSPSAFRAVLMFVLWLVSQICGREYDRWSALSFAGMLILFGQPMQLFQCGFQLTMLSAAGVELYQMADREAAFQREEKKRHCRMVEKLWKRLGPGVMIQLITLPCILYWFSEVSLCGLFLNLLVLPLLPGVVLSGAAGAFAAGISVSGGRLLLAPAHYILKFYESICRAGESLPFGSVICGAPGILECFFLYLGLGLMAWVVSTRKEKDRGKILAAAGGVVFLGIFGMFYPGFTNGGHLFSEIERMKAVFLDVGQGDGIFLRTQEGVTWLIDGGSSSEKKVGKYRLLPFLKNQGIGRLDYVITTHMDEDHINGIRELLEDSGGVSIGMLLLHPSAQKEEQGQELIRLAKEHQIPCGLFYQGMEFQIKNMQIMCLWPKKDTDYSEKNQNSLVLRLSYGETSLLLTGDLEKEAEEELAASGLLKKTDLLKVGHHGSKGASGEKFLEQVHPDTAILSYGKQNRYGHPAAETVERLTQAGAALYRTAVSGAVTAVSDGKQWNFQTFRKYAEK